MLMQDSAAVFFGEVDHLTQDFMGMPAVVGGTGHPDRQCLPAVQVRHFGDRDIEAATDSLHQRAAYLAFSLEAVVFRQLEDELAGAHNHLCIHRIRNISKKADGIAKSSLIVAP